MMLCLSHKGTLDLIDDLCCNHDSRVVEWRDALHEKFLKQSDSGQTVSVYNVHILHLSVDPVAMVV